MIILSLFLLLFGSLQASEMHLTSTLKNPPRLRVLEKTYSLYKLLPDKFDVQGLWNKTEGMLFISKTPGEITVVAETGTLGSCIGEEADWVALEIVGEFPFDVYGLLHQLLGPIADNKIPVIVESTFRTDYIFINIKYLETARAALKESGYQIE